MRRAVCEPISLPEEITCHMGLRSLHLLSDGGDFPPAALSGICYSGPSR